MKMVNNNLAGFPLCLPAGIAALLCVILLPATAAIAETVEAQLPSGITVTANFHAGSSSLPAVLLLHGFLQTNHSPPMSTLADNLASRGYTVLNPTMSLGINRRNQNMACEAVHTHTMEDEVAEVDYWVNWLGKKKYKEIVLTGFSSTGNHAVLKYVTQESHPAIKLAILTNLNPLYTNITEHKKTRPTANERKLSRFSMGYCKNNYTATANSYLSYAQFDENRLLELLRNTNIHTEVILGSADTILPKNWADRIKALQSPVQVRMIKNANHFFDGTQEFDLAEEVESILKNIPVK
jgi:esterase/lipase